MYNDGYELAAPIRVRVTRAVIDSMLLRASRIVNEAESRHGHVAIIPADTFRANLMALAAALDGETRAERLAIDDEGAAVIAQILHEGHGQATLTVPTTLVEQARQLYGTAALAGTQVEIDEAAAVAEPARHSAFSVSQAQYRAVAAAAMMLGEILTRISKAESGECDAG